LPRRGEPKQVKGTALFCPTRFKKTLTSEGRPHVCNLWCPSAAFPAQAGIDGAVGTGLRRCGKALGVIRQNCSTLHMLKAVMSGRGDEIVELARTNLRR
jgi:hypothetical protein